MTKLNYLRALLDHKVRKTIEGLPLTAEGYNRALSILKERFGMEAEIVNVYGKKLLDLPYIPTTPVKRLEVAKHGLTHKKLLGKISQQTLKETLRVGW